MLKRHPAKPLDEDARAALDDPDYAAGLATFGAELSALTDPIWRERYLAPSTEPKTEKP